MKSLSTISKNRFIIALALGFFGFNAQAQLSTISYTAENAVVTQNFDALYNVPTNTLYTNTTGAVVTSALGPWDLSAAAITNKPELAGWQITKLGGSTPDAATIQLYTSSGGNGATNFYNLGKAGIGIVSDRAIGAICNSAFSGAVGVVLINNTGKTMNSFNLSYKGEQWKNLAVAYKIAFKYATGPTSTITDISQGTFNTLPALDFTTPTITGTSTGSDGNDPAYSTLVSQTGSNFTWLPGEALVLRWDFGTAAQMAIDDVVFSASSSLSSLSYATEGAALTQNFDILSTLGSKTFYTNATGSVVTSVLGPWDLSAANIYAKNELKGWQIYKTTGNTPIAGSISMGSSPGGNATQEFYYLGNANTTGADQSLGGAFGGTMAGGFGLVLQNNTGKDLTSFTLTYTGEQWRKTNVAYTLNFKYAIGSAATITDISQGTFTAVPALNFVTPNLLNDIATDGNLDANRAVKTSTVTGISWANGTKLVLRWDCSSGQVSIDDVTFTATSASTAGLSPLKNQSLSITPTVTSDLINVTLNTKSTIIIYNTVGAQVMTTKANEGVNTISLAALNAGIYIVKAEGEIAKVLKFRI
jgi:Secretion system C-terminal sorting domain